MGRLRAAVAEAPFVFVVGKGGVGKSTIASALALELADAGHDTHLISTDPAHSLHDILPTPGSAGLIIEEFDAASFATAWLDHARGAITALLEGGTYLDTEDVASFTDVALPGLDELMAVLRLVDLTGTGTRVIVDTAPTGHMLRLLDAGGVHAGLAAALRAMADKAAVVASSMSGRDVRLSAESIVDELEQNARSYSEDVLRPATFVIAARAGTVVEAETRRIVGALAARGVQVAATVWTGRVADAGAGSCLQVPVLTPAPCGAEALRAWSGAVTGCSDAGASGPARSSTLDIAAAKAALPWLCAHDRQLWVVAGKGGVGKTTCAATLAVALASARDVLLCSADPAGALRDVIGDAPLPDGLRLRTRQIDAPAELDRLRTLYREEALAALESMGLGSAATLDRRVIETLWEMAPPGMDEIAALVAMLELTTAPDVIVLDTAPTGHLLRLLQLPDLALDWVRRLMRLLLKYGGSESGNAAETLLRLARELRGLLALLHDAQRTAALVVTLPEPVVLAETARLSDQLQRLDVPVLATIVNRTSTDSPAPPGNIVAPVWRAPLVGVPALREFGATWKIVT